MKRKIRATVIWPVTLVVEVEEDITLENVDEILLDAAQDILEVNTIKPVITEKDFCNE